MAKTSSNFEIGGREKVFFTKSLNLKKYNIVDKKAN